MKESKDTLQQYVGDMLAVDQHIHEAVRRHRDDKQVQADADAHRLLSRIESTFDTLIEELEQHLKHLGGSASSPVKEAVAGTVGALGSMYDKLRTETVSKMLRDDYTTLGLAAISYKAHPPRRESHTRPASPSRPRRAPCAAARRTPAPP